jgi:hypothetical protein
MLKKYAIRAAAWIRAVRILYYVGAGVKLLDDLFGKS